MGEMIGNRPLTPLERQRRRRERLKFERERRAIAAAERLAKKTIAEILAGAGLGTVSSKTRHRCFADADAIVSALRAKKLSIVYTVYRRSGP